jgi:hypothetical protein
VKVGFEHRPAPQELDGFVGSFPHATFFHTRSWLEALRESFERFDAGWLTAREDGVLAGAMPVVRLRKGPFFSLWSLPFGTYGDPLARDGPTRDALLERFFATARSPRCLEAQAVLFGEESASLVPRGAAVRMEECRLVSLDGGFDEVWRGWSAKRRQLVRRGEEAGVGALPLESEDDVRRFHAIYAAESTSWGGVHPYPERLFIQLHRRRETGVVFWGAFLRGKLIGGHIDFYFARAAQAWQGGMTERAAEFETGAILLKHAMEEACRRGCRSFNLGSSGDNAGILFFKESLGGRERRYPVVTMRKRLWAAVRGRGGA